MSVAVFLILLAIVAAILFNRRKRSGLPLPPGPKPLPIIGNLLDMPTKRLAPAFRELGKIHGDVTYLDMLGKPMVILNTYEAAIALLEGRSANTSDRPRTEMVDLAGFGWVFVAQGYTQEWRARRKAFHGFFQPQSATSKHRPVQVRECRRFLHRLLDTPQQFDTMARGMFGATIMDLVYGIRATTDDDYYLAIADIAAKLSFDIMVPGRYLVELLPFLRHMPSWFPGAGFKRDAMRWRTASLRARNVAYEAALKEIARGGANTSMVAALNEAVIAKNGEIALEDEDYIRDATGLAYLAGADTSVYATRALFLALVQNPEVQKKAQEELDAVVGPDRLPEFADRESLPYVNAIVKEVLRWHSIIPIGISHRAVEEDEYGGYRIPAGSILIPNAWAMSRDPEVYPEPEEFIPERFIEGGKYSTTARDPEKFQFGFGRRICPGRHFVSDALFLTAASLLHAFNITPPLGEDGKPMRVAPNTVLDYFLAWHEPFECNITPRSKQAEQLVREAGEMRES